MLPAVVCCKNWQRVHLCDLFAVSIALVTMVMYCSLATATSLRCCDPGRAAACSAPTLPPTPVASDEVEILMAARATVTPCSSTGSLYLHSHHDHVHILYVGGWSGGRGSSSLMPIAASTLASSRQHFPTTFSWNITIPAPGRHHFSVIAAHFHQSFKLAPVSHDVSDSSPPPILLQLCVASTNDDAHLEYHPPDHTHFVAECCTARLLYRDVHAYGQFTRIVCDPHLLLSQGNVSISLNASGEGGEAFTDMALFSVELESHDLRVQIEHDLLDLSSRSNILQPPLATPFSNVAAPTIRNFGIFTHWNYHSLPLKSYPLNFSAATVAFNVTSFAAAASAASASFVVFTATWASFYLPAPISAVDGILPGRTSERDLLGDIIQALQEQGIQLILYLHYGKDDPQWWSATRFPSSSWWQSWCDIVREIGQRYGKTLAGWWIDDGSTGYYPWKAPFRKMWRALKHGNRDRIVGYNQYYFPAPTRLQDFIAGELSIVDVPALRLSYDQQSRTRSPTEGWPPLYATFSTTLEQGDWTFMRGGSVDSRTGTVYGADLDFSREYTFPPLVYESVDLLAHVLLARDRNVWPIFNVLISQEGTMNPAAVNQLANVAVGLTNARYGIKVRATPHSTQIPSCLARTGPADEGPIFWRQNNHLVGWEHASAFASWLLDVSQCKRGVQVSLNSPCRPAYASDLSASLLPHDFCRMVPFDDDGNCLFDATIKGKCGANTMSFSQPLATGGWKCNNTANSTVFRESNWDCDISEFTKLQATVLSPFQRTHGDEMRGEHLVWLFVSRSVSNATISDLTIGDGEVSCV